MLKTMLMNIVFPSGEPKPCHIESPEREQRQAEYDIAWDAVDMSAAWLGKRLLLYPYVTQPDPGLRSPTLTA